MANRCSNCGAETVEAAAYCHCCGCCVASDKPSDKQQSEQDEPGAGKPADPQRAGSDDSSRVGAQKSAVEQAGVEQAGEPAEHLWSGRYSPLALLPAWILFGLLTLAIGALCVPLIGLGKALFIMLVCGVISWGGVGLYLAYRRLNVQYDLTSRQFVCLTGLLARRTRQLDVIDIDDIAFGQGPLQRRLGVGTIQLTSGDRSRSELILLIGIADVQAVATKIDDARRAERHRRGLYIEIAEPPQPA